MNLPGVVIAWLWNRSRRQAAQATARQPRARHQPGNRIRKPRGGNPAAERMLAHAPTTMPSLPVRLLKRWALRLAGGLLALGCLLLPTTLQNIFENLQQLLI